MAATLGHSPFYETIHLPANFQNVQDFLISKVKNVVFQEHILGSITKYRRKKYEVLRPLTSPGCRGLTLKQFYQVSFVPVLSFEHQTAGAKTLFSKMIVLPFLGWCCAKQLVLA